MTFQEASKHKMTFGKFVGEAVDKVASTDEGLKYLDWLTGNEWFFTRYPKDAPAVTEYLADENIQEELENL